MATSEEQHSTAQLVTNTEFEYQLDTTILCTMVKRITSHMRPDSNAMS